MADMTGWAPVADAAGKVLGWMAPAQHDEPGLDYFEADRPRRNAAIVKARAAALYELAALAGDEAFSAGEVTDMARRAGLTGDQMDAAANAALVLWEIEQQRK